MTTHRITFHRDGTRSFEIDGKKVSENEFRKHKPKGGRGVPHISKAYNRPLKSRSLSVPAAQAREFNEIARASGNTGVYYDEKGTAFFSSRGARRKELKRAGMCDQDGGYSD